MIPRISLKYTFLAVFLASCSTLSTEVDPELYDYAVRFDKDMGVSSKGVGMIFGNMQGTVIGVCSQQGSARQITIKKSYWNFADEQTREQLMYHELAHCVIGLDHDIKVRADGCPVSLMFPTMSYWCYYQYPDYYKNELRSKVHDKLQ